MVCLISLFLFFFLRVQKYPVTFLNLLYESQKFNVAHANTKEEREKTVTLSLDGKKDTFLSKIEIPFAHAYVNWLK